MLNERTPDEIAESGVGFAGGLGGFGGGEIDGDTSALDLSRDAKTFEKLPAELQEAARAYHTELDREIENLKSNFCLNQWHARRKPKPNK